MPHRLKSWLDSTQLSGYKTFVTEKSDLGLPNDEDREEQVVLPPGSATPQSPRKMSVDVRELPYGQFTKPDETSDIEDRPRTLGVPTEDDEHPYKNDYGYVTRRVFGGAYKRRVPWERQERQDPQEKLKDKRKYQRNKAHILPRMKIWYKKVRNNASYQHRRDDYRDNPTKHKRQKVGFYFLPTYSQGWVKSITKTGNVQFELEDGRQFSWRKGDFLTSTVPISPSDEEFYLTRIANTVILYDQRPPESDSEIRNTPGRPYKQKAPGQWTVSDTPTTHYPTPPDMPQPDPIVPGSGNGKVIPESMKTASSGELHIFDFDGTLFRSPYEPEVWDGDWWNDVHSLSEPCVPEHPGSDWWVAPTLSAAKKSISNSNVYAMLMTGRPDHSAFRFRIPELLKQQGLHFDDVRLAPPSNTLAFKKRSIQSVLSQFPFIDTVRIWDDRKSHLPEFIKAIEAMGIPRENIHTTLVRAHSKEPGCNTTVAPVTNPGKPTYLGVFLDSASRAALAHYFPYKFHKAKADHMTIAFSPKPEDLGMVGQRVQMRVVGYAENDRIQAVLVEPIGFRSKNAHPHITISHTDDAKAVESNALLAQGPIEPAPGLMLSGIVDVFPRSLQKGASMQRVASRYIQAMQARELIQHVLSDMKSKAKTTKVRLSKADPKNGQWTFSCQGSDSKPYVIKIKAKGDDASVPVAEQDVLVSCTCDFWRYQGPEHWAKVQGYLLGKPRGTAQRPNEKDSKGKNLLCKHAVAALTMAQKYHRD